MNTYYPDDDSEKKYHDTLVNIAMSFYLDKPCRICGLPITTQDLEHLVWTGYSKDNKARTAHFGCWEKYSHHTNRWVHK